MLAQWFRSRRRRREAAEALYAAIVRQARRPEFYAGYGVADTLDGRFDMIVLHAFIALRRLRAAGPPGQAAAQALLDLMFADFDRSLRELGVSDHSIAKRMKDMVKACYGRLTAYEQGFVAGSDASDALVRNVYRGAEEMRAQAERLAEYVRRAVDALESHPLSSLLAGELAAVQVEDR